MRRTTCDGCLEDIADDAPWFGLDEFDPDPDPDEDEADEELDADYEFHFHRHDDARCLWAWALARMADQQESQ